MPSGAERSIIVKDSTTRGSGLHSFLYLLQTASGTSVPIPIGALLQCIRWHKHEARIIIKRLWNCKLSFSNNLYSGW